MRLKHNQTKTSKAAAGRNQSSGERESDLLAVARCLVEQARQGKYDLGLTALEIWILLGSNPKKNKNSNYAARLNDLREMGVTCNLTLDGDLVMYDPPTVPVQSREKHQVHYLTIASMRGLDTLLDRLPEMLRNHQLTRKNKKN